MRIIQERRAAKYPHGGGEFITEGIKTMEEKILIKSEQYNVKKLFQALLVLGVICSLLISISDIIRCIALYGEIYMALSFLYPIIVSALVGGSIYLWLHSYELTITDKRIFGKVAWGKRVDLPVDSISATATVKFLKGISISTPSGRISFFAIKNAKEIYNVISDLLIERQQEKVNHTTIQSMPTHDTADELKKYKELFDTGVITQEEFDAKKKQLLGL